MLFGTDGMRGVALEAPLDRPTLTRLGAALAEHLRASGRPVRILLAGDSRVSTETLAAWTAGAFVAAGGEAVWAGLLPTPAVSHLLRDDGGFGSGLIVSASHNPAADNGIKLVTGAGVKWPVEEEVALEGRLLAHAGEAPVAPLPALDPRYARRYLELLAATLPSAALAGIRVVVDAANGAASLVAPSFFASLGAAVTMINACPDGGNINADCGALHPEALAAEVLRTGADAGVALDGDADRAIMVSSRGRVLDGDDTLVVWARALAAAGGLPNRAVVATVMSNLGLEAALGRDGIGVVRCPVGDRDVWDAMVSSGAVLGGEQSGHVICAHHAVTGDGMLTAAHLLAIVRARQTPLEELADLERFPQVLLNVPVARKLPLDEMPRVRAAILDAESRLSGSGRIFVRYSGTEPLLRILVEASSRDVAARAAEDVAALVRLQIGRTRPVADAEEQAQAS